MVILVDYDNIEATDRAHGVLNVAYRVLDAIGAARFTDGERVGFRIYGGWYEGQRLTHRAQDLGADVHRSFPTPFTLADAGRRARLKLSGELARGLAADPGGVLLNTFREEGADIGKLKCARAPYTGCAQPAECGLAAGLAAISSDACPSDKCSVGPSHLLRKPQQKLVDTMLTADLVHYATRGERSIGVVSSDDDLWPGIRAALLHGARVAHVHPKRGRKTPEYYTRTATAMYTQHSF